MEPDTAQSNYIDVGRVVRLRRWSLWLGTNCLRTRLRRTEVSALSTECNAAGLGRCRCGYMLAELVPSKCSKWKSQTKVDVLMSGSKPDGERAEVRDGNLGVTIQRDEIRRHLQN